ncbi:hypothetical protein LIER_36877 [Lithospermum erythrorhizon]|uniref:Uncharacterized protein n=1 Tax=Lithospermum erythrorhizon TaxID=34254 RepID=A0AAV3PD66_LITER
MLEVAEVYEDVFHLMARIDNPYKKYFIIGKDNSNYEDDNDLDERKLDLCEEEDKKEKLQIASDRRIGPTTHEDFVKARTFVKLL